MLFSLLSGIWPSLFLYVVKGDCPTVPESESPQIKCTGQNKLDLFSSHYKSSRENSLDGQGGSAFYPTYSFQMVSRRYRGRDMGHKDSFKKKVVRN